MTRLMIGKTKQRQFYKLYEETANDRGSVHRSGSDASLLHYVAIPVLRRKRLVYRKISRRVKGPKKARNQ